MSVQARFFVSTVTKTANGYSPVVLLPAIKGEANKEWAHYTPSGRMELNVSNESGAVEFFERNIGKDVAITFDELDA